MLSRCPTQAPGCRPPAGSSELVQHSLFGQQLDVTVALPQHLPQDGFTTLNIISTAGHQGQPRNVGYCTGKSGLLNFTRSVAMELAEYGIRVNSLTPTATDPHEGMERAARWGRSYGDPRLVSLLEEVRKGVPMQKLPSPRHYARAAVFLASDDAEMMTGTDLRVDAGTVARYWAWTPQATGLWQGITEAIAPKEG